jgi:serine/threonine protein kinase
MPIGKVRKFTSQLLEQLEPVHKVGVVHADVKPENVVLEQDGSGVRLVDFGNSVLIDSEEPRYPTPGYAPPESVEGYACTPAVDVWSAGCVACECYTGRPLFDWKTFDPTKATAKSVEDAITEAVESRRDVSEKDRDEFKNVLMKMLCVDADKRITVTGALKLPFFSE